MKTHSDHTCKDYTVHLFHYSPLPYTSKPNSVACADSPVILSCQSCSCEQVQNAVMKCHWVGLKHWFALWMVGHLMMWAGWSQVSTHTLRAGVSPTQLGCEKSKTNLPPCY